MYTKRPHRWLSLIQFGLAMLFSLGVLAAEVETTRPAADEMKAAERHAAAPGVSESPVQNQVADRVLSLERAIAAALEDNPGLAQMRARAEASAAIPSQAGTLPDPWVSINAMNMPTDTFDFDQENMTQRQIGIAQMLPFPGKLALREKAAGFAAQAAAKNVDEARLLLVRNVTTTWWQLYDLDQSLRIVRRNQDLMRQFVKIAETKYSVGKGLQQDVLLAQLELSKLLDMELRLQGARRRENARLDALLALPADEPVRLPLAISKHMGDLASEKSLFERADQSRPSLKSQEFSIQAASTRVDLAKKDFYPDFKIGATYGLRSGHAPNGISRPDFLSIMFSMNLPLHTGRKLDKAVDQRESELIAQRYQLEDMRDKVHADISAAVADYRRAREQSRLFDKGIIPQARQTVESMLAGYQVNNVDFLNLVRAQITLYNFEISYWQKLTEAKQSLARIVAAVGEENIYE